MVTIMSIHNETAGQKRIKAVIFDLDDTLISEYEFVASGYRFVSKMLEERLGAAPKEIEDRLWELSRQTYSNAFNRLFDSYEEEYTEDELRELILAYRSHPADTRFYPDVEETLKELKEKDILTGIISDGDPERQRNKIRSAVAGMKQHGLHNSPDPKDATDIEGEIRHWFDEIILNDEFGGAEYRKPNPKGFAEMAARLKVDPGEMIYVGDNPAKDFHISAVLPVRTARIIRENGIYHDREYLDGIKETFRIETLTELPGLIA